MNDQQDIFQFLNELREKCRSLTNKKDIFKEGVIKIYIEDLDKLIEIVELKHKEIERLKADIEEALELLKRGGTEYTEVDVEDLVFLIQNGFKQAERVEELKLEINDWRAEVQKWQQFYEESEESYLKTKELLKSILNQSKRYKQALEEILNVDCNLEGLDAERELDRVTDIALKALEGE